MQNYLKTLSTILSDGVDRPGRSGLTRAIFAQQLRWDLTKGFPAVTTKKLAFKQVAAELLWFLGGDPDLNKLHAMDCRIWDADAARWSKSLGLSGNDNVGRIYPAQWRQWRGPNGKVDQIANLVKRLRTDPYSRYLIVTAWNPGEIAEMCLPACHVYFQLFAYPDGRLSLSMTQRSCDFGLGVPFNIASYALLLSMIAQVTGREPFELVIDFIDAHIYHAHFDGIEEQLSRDPFPLPTLQLNPGVKELWDFKPEDIRLVNYQHHGKIRMPLLIG